MEHVLPQSPTPDSDWGQLFTEEQREEWVLRLANLVLLHGVRNSKAGSRSFGEKRQRYQGQKVADYGLSSLPLTDEVLQAPHWDPGVLARQEEHLLQVAKSCFRLHDTAA